jgi:hypothetical protein
VSAAKRGMSYILLRSIDGSLVHTLHDSRTGAQNYSLLVTVVQIRAKADILVMKYIING